MTRPNFKKLYKVLVTFARSALRTFANSEFNKDVYAVAFDAQDEYGRVIVSVNTLADLQRTLEGNYYSTLTAEQIGGLSGVKYNPGDFGHIGLGPESPELDLWSDNFTKYLESLSSDVAYVKTLEKFSAAIVSTINDLTPELDLLDQTPDFIVFHGFHDVSDEVKEALIRKTVDPAMFDRVFPEVRQFREFVDGISARTADEGAEIWLSILESFVWESTDALAEQFYKQHSYIDIRRQLVAIGESALPRIFKLLDRVIFEPQFNVKGSAEWDTEGAFTRFNNVASQLVWTIQDIGIYDETVRRKLLGYIRGLHDLAKTQEDPIGTNLSVLARAVHTLAPSNFPPLLVDPATNRPLNIEAYLSEIS